DKRITCLPLRRARRNCGRSSSSPFDLLPGSFGISAMCLPSWPPPIGLHHRDNMSGTDSHPFNGSTKSVAKIAEMEKYLPVTLYVDRTFALIGVPRSTWRLWLQRGRKEEKRLARPRARPNPAEEIYVQFVGAFRKAMAESQARALGAIIAASKKNWTA